MTGRKSALVFFQSWQRSIVALVTGELEVQALCNLSYQLRGSGIREHPRIIRVGHRVSGHSRHHDLRGDTSTGGDEPRGLALDVRPDVDLGDRLVNDNPVFCLAECYVRIRVITYMLAEFDSAALLARCYLFRQIMHEDEGRGGEAGRTMIAELPCFLEAS